MNAKTTNNVHTSYTNLDHYVAGTIGQNLFQASIDATQGKHTLAHAARELKLLVSSVGGSTPAKDEIRAMLRLHSEKRAAMLALFEADSEACYLQVYGSVRTTGFDLDALKKTLKNQKDAAFKAVNRELHTIDKEVKLGKQRDVNKVTITFKKWEKPAPAVKTTDSESDTPVHNQDAIDNTPAVPVQEVSEDVAVASMVEAFRNLSADNQDKLYRELQVILASRSPATGTVGKAINKAKSQQSIAIN